MLSKGRKVNAGDTIPYVICDVSKVQPILFTIFPRWSDEVKSWKIALLIDVNASGSEDDFQSQCLSNKEGEHRSASLQMQPVGSVTLEEQLMVKLDIPLEEDQFGQKVFSVRYDWCVVFADELVPVSRQSWLMVRVLL